MEVLNGRQTTEGADFVREVVVYNLPGSFDISDPGLKGGKTEVAYDAEGYASREVAIAAYDAQRVEHVRAYLDRVYARLENK